MGQSQSKDELLYQQVNYGNTEGIKALRTEGAGLEWIDREGKTPLIAACMNPELFNVAKTLIELGANVNAYRPGRHAGTPLHHAAKRGLEQTVNLLLSHGANALVINDDCQTPLDVARSKGFNNVVRALEGHLCLFSGWLRELYGPGFLELLAPQLLTRKVWVVILPCGSRNSRSPFKLELAIYSSAQDAQPRTLIPLWKANLDEPNFNQPDPAAVISDISRSTRIKLAPVSESEKQQLQRFCNACKGIPQVLHPSFPFNIGPATAPPAPEVEQLAAAISASLHSTSNESGSGVGASSSSSHEDSYFNGASSSQGASHSKCEVIESGPSGITAQHMQSNSNLPHVAQIENPSAIPSAPVADDVAMDDGPVHYPSIDTSDLSAPALAAISADLAEKRDDNDSSSCTICLDAPLEGACIPCGHMAGCMMCLNEIKAKNWGCPVCRSKIDQVIRIYAV